jgi:hypothetical protein
MDYSVRRTVVAVAALCLIVSKYLVAATNDIPPLPLALEGDLDEDFNFLETKTSFEDSSGSNKISNHFLRTPLPRSIIPTYYRILIRPQFDPVESESERFTIPGSVTIQVDCVSTTKRIRLDSKEIDVKGNRTKVS